MPPEYFSLLKAIEGMAVSSKLDGDTYRTEGVLMLTPAGVKTDNKPTADIKPPSPDDKPPVDIKPPSPENKSSDDKPAVNIKPQAPAGQ
jgi:hypothetical protein